MKQFSHCFVALLFALTMLPGSTEAATPKEGRYKGTMTFLTVVDGNTSAVAKKVIPMAGVLTGGIMVVAMPEVPQVSGKFQSLTFDAAIADGSVQIKGVSGNYFFLSEVRTTTGSIKGSSDFGTYSATGGTGFGRYLIAVTLTRVGN